MEKDVVFEHNDTHACGHLIDIMAREDSFGADGGLKLEDNVFYYD